ncbi:MAG: hypothetical protein AAFV07_03475, partial [Bacteroidota bacterium]
MQRIMLIGCGGAGKSTLSRKLHALTGLPLIHLDRHYFGPGWNAMSPEPWTWKVRELVAGERWIIDGNYGGTMDIRLEAADTIIFMNRSSWICVTRILKRWW